MSGGGTNTQTSSTVPAWLMPYMTSNLKGAQTLEQQGGPQMQQGIAPLNDLQNSGLSSITQAAGQPNANSAANGYLQTLESGSMLNPASNPYLQSAYAQGLQGIQNNQDSQFGAAGRNILASAPVQADQGAVLANSLYEPAYGQTLQAMGQGAALAPGVAQGQYLPGQELLGAGGGLQQQTQNVLNASNNMYNYSQALPYNTASWYSGLLSSGASPFGSSSQTQMPSVNPWMTAAGGALSGAATGATIGSVVPGLGTGIGALIGAGVGGIGGGLL